MNLSTADLLNRVHSVKYKNKIKQLTSLAEMPTPVRAIRPTRTRTSKSPQKKMKKSAK